MAQKIIKFRDRGLKEILSRINVAGHMAGAVGVMGPKAAAPHPLRENITVGEVAIINEYGSTRAGVPRRSYLKSTFDEHRDLLLTQMAQAVAQVVELRVTAHAAFKHVGEIMAEKVREKIASGEVPPPDAPKTVEDKGHDRTLTNTGALYHAIDSSVIEKRDGVFIRTSGPLFPDGEGES